MAGRTEAIAEDPDYLMSPELVVVGEVIVTGLGCLADIG